MDLQDKLPSRLRKRLFQEYRTSKSLEAYVEAIQAEDQGQFVERTYFKESSTAKPGPRKQQILRGQVPKEQPAPSSSQSQSRSVGWTDRRPTPNPNQTFPARADTPRAETPANAPRHFSSQPNQRSITNGRPTIPYRVNEIESGQPDDEMLEDGEEECEDTPEEPQQPSQGNDHA